MKPELACLLSELTAVERMLIETPEDDVTARANLQARLQVPAREATRLRDVERAVGGDAVAGVFQVCREWFL